MKINLFLSRLFAPKRTPAADEQMLIQRKILALLDDPWYADVRPGPDGKLSVDTLCQLTRHHNGYVRENAVAALAVTQDIAALEALLACVNDWVKPIHLAATAAVIALLTPVNAPAFIAQLAQIRQLNARRRYDHRAFVSHITGFLVAKDLPGLQQTLHSPLRALRDAALQTLIEQDRLYDETALLSVLANRDSNLRAIAVAYWLGKNRLLSDVLVMRLLRDPWARIRREVLFYLDAHGQLPPSRLHHALLLDKNTLIQQRTRRMLENVVDATALWLQVVPSAAFTQAQRRSALYGLKEVAYPDLLPLARWSYTQHVPALRKAALHILLTLEGDDAKARILDALAQPSLSLSLTALKLLSRSSLVLTPAEVQHLLDNPASADHRFIYWRLLPRLNKWDWLILLLRNHARLAEHDRDEQCQIWVSRYNQAGIAATVRQRETLAALLPSAPEIQAAIVGYLP